MPFSSAKIRRRVDEMHQSGSRERGVGNLIVFPTAMRLSKNALTAYNNLFSLAAEYVNGQSLTGELSVRDSSIHLTRSYSEKPAVSVERPMTLELPPLLETGLITVSTDKSKVVASIKFDLPTLPILTYSTRHNEQNGVSDLMERLAILASLPEDLFLDLEQLGEIVVISTSLSDANGLLDKKRSTKLKLSYKNVDDKKTVEAEDIRDLENVKSVFFLLNPPHLNYAIDDGAAAQVDFSDEISLFSY